MSPEPAGDLRVTVHSATLIVDLISICKERNSSSDYNIVMWKLIVDAWNGIEDKDDKQRDPANIYDFQGIKALVQKRDPSVILVDVREPKEFEEYRVPGSVNVPFRTHPEGFGLGDREFEKAFGFPKPSKDKRLVFFCASGRRAASAEGVAEKHGYHNVALYPGSVHDWLAQGGDKLNL